MNQALIAIASALWLGILTSISPCPLATNLAAISYLSKKVLRLKSVLWSSIAYTAGRMCTYGVLGFIIINSLLSVPAAAQFLQKYMNKALGLILVFMGLFLLNIIKIKIPRFSISSKKQEGLAQSGIKGSFALGVLFALSFCPLSAALFFGSLIPLALQYKFGAGLPFIYGIGTGLPILFFAVCIALGVKSLSRWLHKLSRVEYYTRRITGAIFILAGLYLIWIYLI